MTVTLPAPLSAAIPDGRGRWRVTLHARTFGWAAPLPTWQHTVLVELSEARGRRLDQQWDQPAQFTFTLDGRSPACAAILELQCDVYVWRWDEASGADVCAFRGPITQSEDQLTEQSHVVTFTAHDYLAMLQRRIITPAAPWVISATSQDVIARTFVNQSSAVSTASGTDLRPGSTLPIATAWVNPDGSPRADAGVLRDRTYTGGSIYGELLDQLAKVDGGFDYDIVPEPAVRAGLGAPAGTTPVLAGYDALRVFYPAQGVTRTDMLLAYGANVSGVTRSLNSADYANYVRSIGNKASADPNAAQMFAEVWNTDANAIGQNNLGLWMMGDNASDVSVQATLNQHAQGLLNVYGTLTPNYTLGLRPDTYTWGSPRMGDVVPLRIQSGRLNVNTSVRVVGISYDIGDDGTEDVALTVGRPAVSLGKMLTAIGRDVDALARR